MPPVAGVHHDQDVAVHEALAQAARIVLGHPDGAERAEQPTRQVAGARTQEAGDHHGGDADLVADLGPGVGRGAVVEAVQALQRRSLLKEGGGGTFTLQPVVLEHATERLVEAVEQEVLAGRPALLVRHALLKAPARDFVRRSQERLVAGPLLERLSTGGTAMVERRLLDLLGAWRGRPPEEQGYGPGNVLNLLRLLRGEVRGLDFSRLTLRQVYLADVEAQDASLAGAHLAEAVLAEAFADPTSVALSADGALLAAGTIAGEVCLWRVADRSPLLAVRGHSGPIFGVALSGDGRLVAGSSFDGMVRLWEVASGRPLATLRGHDGGVWGVALSADGHLLASGGMDGTVRLWDVQTGTCRQVLQPDRLYERLDITGLTGVTEAQRAALLALGAVRRRA